MVLRCWLALPGYADADVACHFTQLHDRDVRACDRAERVRGAVRPGLTGRGSPFLSLRERECLTLHHLDKSLRIPMSRFQGMPMHTTTLSTKIGLGDPLLGQLHTLANIAGFRREQRSNLTPNRRHL